MKFYTDEGNLDWVFNNTVCSVAVLVAVFRKKK